MNDEVSKSEQTNKPEGDYPARGGNGTTVNPSSQARQPQEISRRKENAHRDGRDPLRGVDRGPVPSQRDSSDDLLQVAKGFHGGG